MVAAIFGRPSFDLPALSAKPDQGDPIMKPQATIADAKDSLVNVIDRGMKFMVSIVDVKYSHNVPEEILVEQMRLDQTFDTWLCRFNGVTESLRPQQIR